MGLNLRIRQFHRWTSIAFTAGVITYMVAMSRGTPPAWMGLLALVPLILAYRLLPAGDPLFIAGMAASVLFMTMLYGPVFTVIEAELPPHLKATATGINILALNILMIGGLAMAIGIGSQWLASAGRADAWTWPLLGADLVAFIALGFLWAAYRAGKSVGRPGAVHAV